MSQQTAAHAEAARALAVGRAREAARAVVEGRALFTTVVPFSPPATSTMLLRQSASRCAPATGDGAAGVAVQVAVR